MITDWESILKSWSEPPGITEQTKCENSERMVKDAIKAHDRLSAMDTKTFAHGSYAVRTNVRQDSDVDICVRLNSTFYYRLPDEPPNTPDLFGIYPSDFTYAEFKKLVGEALTGKFGTGSVTPGDKAFEVHENTYRIDAHVAPTFEYRWYTGAYNADGSPHYHSGVELLPDKGGSIINWPDQTYENGVIKNTATGGRYKDAIRILKRLRNHMEDDQITAAKDIASFLIECLVWNVPDEGFGSDLYVDNIRCVLAHTFNETLSIDKCREWGEVNELKYLFGLWQPWTLQHAHGFLSAAWDYIGYK